MKWLLNLQDQVNLGIQLNNKMAVAAVEAAPEETPPEETNPKNPWWQATHI